MHIPRAALGWESPTTSPSSELRFYYSQSGTRLFLALWLLPPPPDRQMLPPTKEYPAWPTPHLEPAKPQYCKSLPGLALLAFAKARSQWKSGLRGGAGGIKGIHSAGRLFILGWETVGKNSSWSKWGESPPRSPQTPCHRATSSPYSVNPTTKLPAPPDPLHLPPPQLTPVKLPGLVNSIKPEPRSGLQDWR